MAGNNGGARPGAGRKPTGAKTKCYTVTLPLEEAELLEKHAAQLDISVNKYLRELIQKAGKYSKVSLPKNQSNKDQEEKPYAVKSHKKSR